MYIQCVMKEKITVSTFGDYKSYKKYAPQYAEWKDTRDLADAKRQEYLRQNPSAINQDDIKKSKALLRAIDVMDEYSQKRAEDTEVATEEIIGWGVSIAMALGAGLGLLFKNNKGILKLSSKFTKDEKALPEVAKLVSGGIGGILGLTAASFPLYSWAAKAETKASRKGRFEAMNKELKDPKIFATLNDEQEKKLNENLEILKGIKEEKDYFKGLKESWGSVKGIVVDSKEYLEQKTNFEIDLIRDKKHFDKELTPEEIEDAKHDQQLLTKLVEKIDIASQDYAENAELATSALITGTFAFSTLFSLLYEKVAKSLNLQKTSVPAVLSGLLMFGASIWGASVQKEAARVGRFKAKQELMNNPERLVYVPDEKTGEIKDIQISNEKKGFFKFMKEAWKNSKEYDKWKKNEGAQEKKLSKALENIELTDEQLKEAKRLQYNTFKTFNKVDEKSQKYAESIEALGQSIQAPLVQLLSLIGIGVGSKFLVKGLKSKIPAEKTIGFIKYFMTVLGFTLPSIAINAYITKEQKKASRVANMLAIDEMQDYRNFADYSKYKISANY